MGRTIALSAALIGALALAWVTERTPEPLGRNAPAAAFSASRAMADIEVIALRPHPIGSQQNAEVRDHLVRRMRALGLETSIQPGVGVIQSRFMPNAAAAGVVENVVGVLPGRDRAAPALALMAHYDSVPNSPGAADDAAGVASALEVVRALKEQGQPARDVMLLMTDGEEAGLLGARAYFADPAKAKRIGFLINLESRGGGGRAQMFQSGPDNSGTVRMLQKAAVDPSASSAAVFLYERLPNDTDFSVTHELGVPGMNYAFIGRQFDYHSPTSTPANLQLGSVQHMGQEVLAASRAVAFADQTPQRGENLVFSQTFGRWIVAYPQQAGWLVLAAAACLSAVGAWRAARAGAFRSVDVARGAGACLFAVLGAATLLHAARRATGAGFGFIEQRWLLAQIGRWETAAALLAVAALLWAAAAVGRGRGRSVSAGLMVGAGLVSAALGHGDLVGLALGMAAALIAVLTFGRPAALPGAWTGVLVVGFIVAGAIQAFAAPMAFLVAWPLLAAALASAITSAGASRGVARTVLLVVVAVVVGGWALRFGHNLFLGPDLPEILAVIVLVSALVLWPLAQPETDDRIGRRLALALVALGVIATLGVRLAPPWTPRHPQVATVVHYADLNTGKQWRLNTGVDMPDWTRHALTAEGGRIVEVPPPGASLKPATGAAARPIPLATRPVVALTRMADGALQLRAAPAKGAYSLALTLKADGPITAATLEGRPVKLLVQPGEWARVQWYGDRPITLTLRPSPGAHRLDVRYGSTILGWPAGATPLPKRPSAVSAFNVSDSLVIGGKARFTW